MHVNELEGDAKMTDELQKLAPPPAGALTKPDFIDARDKTGTEHIGKDDLRLPRLGIAQGLSFQMRPGDPAYIDGLKLYEMFNDLTNQIYGRGPLTFIPIHHQTLRIEFDEDGKIPLDRNVPANDDRMLWHGDEPPKAMKFTELACLLWNQKKEMWEPIIISIREANKFARQSAERIVGFIKFQDGPIYAGFKTAKVEAVSNDEGQWGVFVFENAGFIQDQVLYDYCAKLHKSFEGKVLETNRETETKGEVPF